MSKPRKQYSPEFKARLVMELLREEKSVAELAAEHGVHPTQLHKWRKQATESLSAVFSRQQSWQTEKAAYEHRIEELYADIGRLSAQLSWLKKKGIDVEPE